MSIHHAFVRQFPFRSRQLLLGCCSGLLLLAAGCKKTAVHSPPAPAEMTTRTQQPQQTGRSATAQYRTARANLQSRAGSDISGWVEFSQQVDGDAVVITAQVEGLSSGKHGFHIHQQGDCSAGDFSSAGGHFAPDAHPHGKPSSQSHAGDLGNIQVEEPSELTLYRITSNDVTLTDGKDSIIGRAVVIHQNADDLSSQPSGAAGPRVACGRIELTTPRPQAKLEQPPEKPAASRGSGS